MKALRFLIAHNWLVLKYWFYQYQHLHDPTVVFYTEERLEADKHFKMILNLMNSVSDINYRRCFEVFKTLTEKLHEPFLTLDRDWIELYQKRQTCATFGEYIFLFDAVYLKMYFDKVIKKGGLEAARDTNPNPLLQVAMYHYVGVQAYNEFSDKPMHSLHFVELAVAAGRNLPKSIARYFQ